MNEEIIEKTNIVLKPRRGYIHLCYHVGMFEKNVKFYQMDIHAESDKALNLFQQAYEEDSYTAIENLFCLGDMHDGKGGNELFSICFQWLAGKDPESVRNLIQILPQYVTWKDILPLVTDIDLKKEMTDLLMGRISADLTLIEERRPASSLSLDLPLKEENPDMAISLMNLLGLDENTYEGFIRTLREKAVREDMHVSLITDYEKADDQNMLEHLHFYNRILILMTEGF